MSRDFLLTPPNAIGLPAPERGDAPMPVTSALVDEFWPRIERLLGTGRVAEAISLMELLALKMRRATEADAPLFHQALTLARRVLYDNLAQVGRSAESKEVTELALRRCAAWDEELRGYIEELISS